MRRGRAVAAMAWLGILAGCAVPAPAAAPSPQPPVIPGQATAGPDLSGVRLPDFVMPVIKGKVARPSPTLTPGQVTTTDANVVCARPRHAAGPAPSVSLSNLVYTRYGYTTAKQQFRYYLDMLVPWNLGGAVTAANLWPASAKGTGFYQKIETDHILRDLVCRRYITLTQAQHALETNWYASWLRYVVLAGHL
jgi:hypothetical protein